MKNKIQENTIKINNNLKLTNILTFKIKIVINRETILFGYREVFETFKKNSTLIIILIIHPKLETGNQDFHVAQGQSKWSGLNISKIRG